MVVLFSVFLRKLHTAFRGSCTSLRSYRHWARVQFLYILICCLFSWWQPCWLPWVKSPKSALIDMLATFLTVPTVWPPCQQDTSLCSLNAWWPLGPLSLRLKNRLHLPLFLYECSFDWKQILYMAETTSSPSWRTLSLCLWIQNLKDLWVEWHHTETNTFYSQIIYNPLYNRIYCNLNHESQFSFEQCDINITTFKSWWLQSELN